MVSARSLETWPDQGSVREGATHRAVALERAGLEIDNARGIKDAGNGRGATDLCVVPRRGEECAAGAYRHRAGVAEPGRGEIAAALDRDRTGRAVGVEGRQGVDAELIDDGG